MCDKIEIERGDSEMVKRINKSIRTYVNKWLCTSWLVIIVALAGSATSMAGPWADRAIARRTARSDRTDVRNNQRQADATYGAGDRSNAIAVIVPENTLRPGVVRRLSRRGISVEELNSFTRRRKSRASCRRTRHCLPDQSKWLPSQNTVGYQYTICSKFEKNGHAFRATC